MTVSKLPVRPKDTQRGLALAPTGGGCRHRRATVDERLAELTCSDCGEKLNPITFLANMARQESRWEWEHKRIADARRQLDERRRCRCTKCGEWTEIRRVGKREAERIARAADSANEGRG